MLFNHSVAQQNVTVKRNKTKQLYGGYVGLGVGYLTDNLSQHFNYPILLPITADFIYNWFVAQISLDGGWAKVKNTMSFDDGGSWNKGQNSFHEGIGINLGGSVYNSKNIRITPVAGYSYNYISKKWWGSSDIRKNEPEFGNLRLAFMFDFKNTFITKKNAMATINDDYAGLRVTAEMYMQLNKNTDYPEYYNGMVINISVGIVLLSIIS